MNEVTELLADLACSGVPMDEAMRRVSERLGRPISIREALEAQRARPDAIRSEPEYKRLHR